ncbi:MAG: UPF0149 family protein [gamma proteobacterium symbiont of Bathyaustriella thionipta]|nr:UPF0149 family protein [gamma proteobacterium symbiont of Bathyaustriella thionipta]
MPKSVITVSYARRAKLLAAAGGDVSPAEADGLLSGLLGIGYPQAAECWVAELIETPEEGDVLAAECASELRLWFQVVEKALQDDSFSFTLFLPPDEEPLLERARALKEWVEGYLYGLGLGGKKALPQGDDIREGLRDLSDLTRMDIDALKEETDESNEAALMQLSEYVRLLVMMIAEEKRHESN